MSNTNNEKTKEKSFFNHLIGPTVTALIVGGTAPWWVELIKENEPLNIESNSNSIENSENNGDSEGKLFDDSLDFQGSGNVINSDSVTASDNSVVQQTDGSGSNISAGRDVTINESPKSVEVPRFEGEIGSGVKSAAFREFIQDNDNKVVFLDVYIDSQSVDAEDRRDKVWVCIEGIGYECSGQSFRLSYDCSDPDPGGAVIPCFGMVYSINEPSDSNSLFSYVQGAYYLKGFWSIRTNPGMWQGVMSTSLTHVEVEDAN